MTFSDSLAILGLILTIGFGIWGIIIAVQKRYPGKLTFVEENASGLFSAVVRNFPEIKIRYNETDVSERMLYLKASLINTGSIDLSTKALSQKLRIEIPKGSRWINYKVTGHSHDVQCILEAEDNALKLDFDLLRKDEFVQFEGLADLADAGEGEFSFDRLKFSHRIPNTGKIDRQSYLSESNLEQKRKKFKKSLLAASLMLIYLLATTSYKYFAESSVIEYKYPVDGKEQPVKLSSAGPGHIEIRSLKNEDVKKVMSIPEFNQPGNLKASVAKLDLWEYLKDVWSYLFSVVLIFIITFPEYRAMLKHRKIKNVIEGNGSH